jgi:hypothetical protein
MKFKIIATIIIVIFLLALTFLFNSGSASPDDPNAQAAPQDQPAQ